MVKTVKPAGGAAKTNPVKPEMPMRSNAGGAVRGQARAAQVKAMNATRKAASTSPSFTRKR